MASASRFPVAFPIELWHSPVGKPNDRLSGTKPHETEKGCTAGNAGPDGPQDSRCAGTAARLWHAGAIASEWGPSENNRRARFYRLTRGGHKLLESEKRDWEQTAAIIARFFVVKAEDLA
jgi:hypothetical protein